MAAVLTHAVMVRVVMHRNVELSVAKEIFFVHSGFWTLVLTVLCVLFTFDCIKGRMQCRELPLCAGFGEGCQ